MRMLFDTLFAVKVPAPCTIIFPNYSDITPLIYIGSNRSKDGIIIPGLFSLKRNVIDIPITIE
jgi:hypothetical protein